MGILILTLVAVIGGGGVLGLLAFLLKVPTVFFAVGLCVLVSMLLSALPLLISYVQTTSRDRQIEKLKSIRDHALAATSYYRSPGVALESIRPARVTDIDYAVPIVSFCVVVMFSCLLVFLGGFPEVDDLFKRNTFVLGGMYTLNETDGAKIANYQKGTLLVASIAFIGSYIYMLARLLDRINNNDIYPISYYYYIVRFAMAALIAMVLRHVFTLMSNESAAILLVAFAIGFTPDLFIAAMLRRAFQAMKVTGAQNDPEESVLPTSLSLLMIEGLSREKIDRLMELGIDNAQVLSHQNPFIIWPRLPYGLVLITDWIAQAQLYCFAKEAGTKALRAKGISTIFDLHTGLKDGDSAKDVAAAAGISPPMIAASTASLEANPAFRHLKEVRDAL